jgi:flavodoxin
MKSIVIYDTVYGNTEIIARTISENIQGASTLARVGDAKIPDLSSVELVIIGSPTQGGRPFASIRDFLAAIPKGKLQGIGVAAFDTRTEVKGSFLKLVVRLLGYAAPRILNELQSKGGRAVSLPQGFEVTGKEGPIIAGETERAASWATTLGGAP